VECNLPYAEASGAIQEHMLKFLGWFYLSTVSLSSVYYPTSLLMMHVIIEIVDHLNQFENDDTLR
jgi:hypothetical protein